MPTRAKLSGLGTQAATEALVGVAGDELADLLEDALTAPEPEDILVLDDAMAVRPEDLLVLNDAVAVTAPDEPEDVLVLDDAMAVSEPEDLLVLDDTMAISESDIPEDLFILDDAMAVAAPGEPEELLVLDDAMAVSEREDDPIIPTDAADELDEAFLAALPPYEPPVSDECDPLVEAEPEPEAEPGPAMPDPVAVARMVAALLAAYGVEATERGDRSLPERLDILVQLLAEPPPANDFMALDLLYACWPKNTANASSRALLAVALNLSSCFGLPGRLPMAMSKAWRMLDPVMFEAELAQRLAGIGDFISGWQRQQSTFLILEFGEIELIEYLFESLPPSRYSDLLGIVMDFKVLSNRRMGLLRRMPNQLKKQIQTMLPDGRDEALLLLAHSKAFLEKLAQPPGFPPLMETAARMCEDVEKLMKLTAAPAPKPGAGAGQALGKIG